MANIEVKPAMRLGAQGGTAVTMAILIAGVLLAYASILRGLWQDWWTDPDASHGLVIPLVAAALVYMKRQQILQLEAMPARWTGTALIAVSQLLLLTGDLGGEFFLERTSLIILAVGIVLVVGGWQHLRALAVPLLLLQLCIPLPTILMHQVTGPLQLIASQGAEELLRALGTPVYREGNILYLTGQTLNVTEACSGIRSLISLLTIAILMGTLAASNWLARTLLILSTPGIAIVTNILRIGGDGLIATRLDPRYASGNWHLLEGLCTFVVAFFILWGELKILPGLGRRPGAAQ
jgi:exosortase